MYTAVTVKQILDRKGRQVWSVNPDDSVLDALHFMAEKNIGAVMVIEGDQLVGIFSERDYARKVTLEGKNERDTLIKEVMTDQVIAIRPDQKIEACLALMTSKFVRHLPVVDDDQQIVGIISIGDVVKEVISEQEFVIDQLVHYISGQRPVPPVPEKSKIHFE